MSVTDKYIAIAACTSEHRGHHRSLTEEALGKLDISDEFRRELEVECKRVTHHEKQEESRDGKKSSSGGNTSGGKNSGSGGDLAHGKESDKSLEEKEAEKTGTEVIEMLFFQAERNFGITQLHDTVLLKAPVAAETLLFNRDNGVAQIHVPFWIARGSLSTARGVFLPMVEQHALAIGARQLQVRVHAQAAAAFQKEHGYVTHGEIAIRSGTPIQKMVKNLLQSMLPKNEVT